MVFSHILMMANDLDSGNGANAVVVKMKDGKQKSIGIDEDGFIANPSDWCPEYAEAVANDEGITGLTDDHWKVINYLRGYYQKFESCPPIRMLVNESGYDLICFYRLFPTGPANGACSLAGAPKPTGCV